MDTEAALFFSVLRDVLTSLNQKPFRRKPVFHLASGEALELWMVKVACGVFFSSIASKDQERLSKTHLLPRSYVRNYAAA